LPSEPSEIQDHLASGGGPLRLRVGLNLGDVIVGQDGNRYDVAAGRRATGWCETSDNRGRRRRIGELVGSASDTQVPEVARACVATLGVQLRQLKAQVLELDRRILVWHRSSEASRRLNHIPGVGPLLATALVASIADPKAFRSGRDFSGWIGLVPKQNSSGGKDKLGNISKRGDRYLRSLFTAGALAVIRYAKIHGTKHRPWLVALLARRPTKVAAIALANKLARIAWALMTKGSRYRQPAALMV
jgi:transposase